MNMFAAHFKQLQHGFEEDANFDQFVRTQETDQDIQFGTFIENT